MGCAACCVVRLPSWADICPVSGWAALDVFLSAVASGIGSWLMSSSISATTGSIIAVGVLVFVVVFVILAALFTTLNKVMRTRRTSNQDSRNFLVASEFARFTCRTRRTSNQN